MRGDGVQRSKGRQGGLGWGHSSYVREGARALSGVQGAFTNGRAVGCRLSRGLALLWTSDSGDLGKVSRGRLRHG